MSATRKNVCNLIFVALVLAALVTFAVLHISTPKKTESNYENRMLATCPTPAADAVRDGSFHTALEKFLQDHMPYRTELQTLDVKLRMNVLHQPVVNDIVIGDDVLLPFYGFEKAEEEQVRTAVTEVASIQSRFNRIVRENGGVYYYVAVPTQANLYKDLYPSYMQPYVDRMEENKNTVLSALVGQGVECIDMGDTFFSYEDRDLIGSRIDHHCTQRGSYEIYRAIAEKLASDGIEIDFPTEDEITFETLPNPFSGSRSKKVLNLFPNEEHLLYARFRSSPSFEWFGSGKSDDFYNFPNNDTKKVSYTFYMGGDRANFTIRNNDKPDAPSVLIYGDSFTNGLETMLWYSFSQMHSCDLRQVGAPDLEQMIEQYQPDVVVCVRDYSVLLDLDGNGSPLSNQEP